MSQLIVRMKDKTGSTYHCAEFWRIYDTSRAGDSSHTMYIKLTEDPAGLEKCAFFSTDGERIEKLFDDIQKHRLFCFDKESLGFKNTGVGLLIDLDKHCGAITDFIMDEEDKRQLNKKFPDFVL